MTLCPKIACWAKRILPPTLSQCTVVFLLNRFANGPCQGSGNQNGTCFTEQECESRGGTNAGSCASGFGVCCISMFMPKNLSVHFLTTVPLYFILVTISCGQMSSENCTYFDSSDIADVTDGCCVAEICPCGDHICQVPMKNIQCQVYCVVCTIYRIQCCTYMVLFSSNYVSFAWISTPSPSLVQAPT